MSLFSGNTLEMSEEEKKRYRDAMKLMFGNKGSDTEGP